MKLRLNLIGDQAGSTAIEYGLIVAILCLGVIAGISGLGSAVSGMYELIVNSWPT